MTIYSLNIETPEGIKTQKFKLVESSTALVLQLCDKDGRIVACPNVLAIDCYGKLVLYGSVNSKSYLKLDDNDKIILG